MRGHYEAVGGAGLVVALHLIRSAVGVHVGGTVFKEPGAQHVLKENIIECTPGGQHSSNGIMGYGGALTLVNGSPFEWTLSGQSSYQMDTWKWPNVAAGTTERLTDVFVHGCTNVIQGKRLEFTSNLERSGLQRTTLAKHTTTLLEPRRNFRYSEKSQRITNSLYH